MKSVVVLSGGVGGAKLVHGLSLAEPDARLTVIVNTGDDFRHLGLHVSPDIDTVLYTLAGKANRIEGWGREGETWSFMDAIASLKGPTWFRLGDGDLALHVVRSFRLAAGDRLSLITAEFARAWGIRAQILPATDDGVATMLDTEVGELEFQDYFVARRCAPVVRSVRFAGVASATPCDGVLDAIGEADAVLFAPSNPYLSIDPILAIGGIRERLRETKAPVVAVSPVIDGRAVKGPTAKLMTELGAKVDPQSIAAHYSGLIDALLIDRADRVALGDLVVGREDILMHSAGDRVRVARAAVALAEAVAA